LNDAAKQVIPAAYSITLHSITRFRLRLKKADGAYLWDADGNQYIDFLQAGGPTVLGSNYAPVREKVIGVAGEPAGQSLACSMSTN